MTELTLELDSKASESINDLMKYYKVNDRGELISKAIAILKIAAHVGQTGGQIFIKKGTHETRLIVS